MPDNDESGLPDGRSDPSLASPVLPDTRKGISGMEQPGVQSCVGNIRSWLQSAGDSIDIIHRGNNLPQPSQTMIYDQQVDVSQSGCECANDHRLDAIHS